MGVGCKRVRVLAGEFKFSGGESWGVSTGESWTVSAGAGLVLQLGEWEVSATETRELDCVR